MAFLASLRDAYTDVTSRAKRLKKFAEDSKAQMLAGPVSANLIKQILEICIQTKAANQATAVLPNIVTYAEVQEGAGYDVSAAWTAMNSAIDGVGAQVLSDVPTGTGSFRLVETWTASGVVVRTFTTAQTANLRNTLDTLIASID